MPDPVKPRPYRSQRRAEQSARTRSAVLSAAARLFLEHGYATTTMATVAREAGVALDTVYAAVGTKPVLFRLLLETAISGTDDAVPAEQRDYVAAIRAEPTASRKLETYAAALAVIHPRLAPLVAVLEQAAATEPDLRALWEGISDRRAANMRRLADELIATGELRPGADRDEVADTLWVTNAPEVYLLLTRRRGWDAAAYETWLADSWKRLLLA